MKRVFGVLLAGTLVTTFCLSTSANALTGIDVFSQAAEETRRRAEAEARQNAETEQSGVLGTQSTQQDVEAQRKALEQRLSEKRAAIAEKLSGERAKRCLAKQNGINQALDARSSAAEKHLDRLEAAQEKLTAYVERRQLTVDNATALAVIMNDEKAAAQAAVSSLETVDFLCSEADAAAPGRILIEQISEAKQALRDYRSAIKDYAAAVRLAATAAQEEQQ